jgi:hypothetical protein
MLVGELAMFASRVRVLLGLFVLVEVVVMGGLVVVMGGGVMMRGGLVVVLARLVRRLRHALSSLGDRYQANFRRFL